jgi:hypothetical protein
LKLKEFFSGFTFRLLLDVRAQLRALLTARPKNPTRAKKSFLPPPPAPKLKELNVWAAAIVYFDWHFIKKFKYLESSQIALPTNEVCRVIFL